MEEEEESQTHVLWSVSQQMEILVKAMVMCESQSVSSNPLKRQCELRNSLKQCVSREMYQSTVDSIFTKFLKPRVRKFSL